MSTHSMTFGEIGKLNDDGEKIQCHLCGKRYSLLAIHIVRTHGLTCEEYKEKFGLNRIQPLASAAQRELRRELHSERLAALGRTQIHKIQLKPGECRYRGLKRRAQWVSPTALGHKESTKALMSQQKNELYATKPELRKILSEKAKQRCNRIDTNQGDR